MKKLGYLVGAATVALTFAGPAQAAPISGTIGFGGAGTPDQVTNFFDVDGDSAVVTFATGTLAGVTSPLTFNDFFYDGSALPISPLWTDGVYAFNLDTISSFDDSQPDIITSFGSGTITSTVAGEDDTPYRWSFSSDTVGGTAIWSFSSTNAPIPEPATLGLLGIGLAGLGFAARRRRQAA